ncbi:DNA-binding transcriptional regulator LsrR, DeoR family [Ignavigranum ruoffiae]|uniref:DNA-binding transcriptional regulator LsrR, DeoR family n=1 Tax=Ignavigranum ruoffiae TaxID=89093 RepID=A0A1H9F402_9LACT|nr:sugar-binding transcriptional regulator [Ignavigranum ruoffiae]SEQ32607.1 DNA-binding transcriptional regulator LsrR, DeoR family [Ignavigranum ruoffiae]
MNPVEERDLVEISLMYYQEGLTQAEIARKFNVSRSLISKLLIEAKERGIVEIFIKSELAYTINLERKLINKYHLEFAYVVDTFDLSDEEIEKRVAQRSAIELSKKLYGKNIGISWGNTLKRMVDYFPFINSKESTIVPLIGGMSADNVDLHSNQLSYKLAQKMRATPTYLYAPALMENETIKQQLISNPVVKNIINSMSSVDVALLGISTVDSRSTMRRIGYISKNEHEIMKELNVVGDINSRFFDINGKEINHAHNNNVIGMNLTKLKNIPLRVTIVDKPFKTEAVRTALETKLLNGIILIDKVAEELI